MVNSKYAWLYITSAVSLLAYALICYSAIARLGPQERDAATAIYLLVMLLPVVAPVWVISRIAYNLLPSRIVQRRSESVWLIVALVVMVLIYLFGLNFGEVRWFTFDITDPQLQDFRT